MSQRSEKLRRQVDQLRTEVDVLKEKQVTYSSFSDALNAVTAQADRSHEQLMVAERKKTREAQREARTWRLALKFTYPNHNLIVSHKFNCFNNNF